MSQKEVDRVLVLAKVQAGQISLRQAAREMALSYPQTKRIWSRYKKEGPQGLRSRKRGAKSNRAVSEEKRKKIVRIISRHYHSCKPLFIAQKLEQYHEIKYSSEFIRQIMIEYHLWFPKIKKDKSHPRRPRRASEGELLQGDASNHDWFEGRGSRCHLHLFIDDATSKLAGGWFELEETTKGYYKALEPVLKEKGRPVALYTDKRSTFVVNHGKQVGKTQFARTMQELGIGMIAAHSPQAKGRIERAFGTLQNRLVWEMRIKSISTIEEANAFLPKFFEDHNKRYAQQPLNQIDAYRPLDEKYPLKYIFSTKEEKKASKNLEVQYQGQIYQLHPPESLRLRVKNAKVSVITTLSDEIAFEYQNHLLKYVRYGDLEQKEEQISQSVLLANWKDGRSRSVKPSKHHPWK